MIVRDRFPSPASCKLRANAAPITHSYPWSYILYSVEQPFRIHHYHDGEYYQDQTALGDYSDLPLYRATNWVSQTLRNFLIREVFEALSCAGNELEHTLTICPLFQVTNSRDGLREGDEDQVPLQFYYEPADCRIYYTPAMSVDQTAAWKTVADAAWGGIDSCVAGSYSGEARKRSEKPMHRVRRDVSAAEHYKAMSEVWTGKGDITMGGDGLMIP